MKTNIDLTAVAETYGIYYTVRETQAMCLHGRYAVEHKYMGVLEHFSSKAKVVCFIDHMVVAMERMGRLHPTVSTETKIAYAKWYAWRRFMPRVYDRPVSKSTIHQRLTWWRAQKELEANTETVSFGSE